MKNVLYSWTVALVLESFVIEICIALINSLLLIRCTFGIPKLSRGKV